jgi:hypothetical protein
MAKSKKKQSKNYDYTYESWVEFSNEMGEKLNALAKDQVSEYKELNKLWNEYASKMTEHMSAFSPEDHKAYEGMQQLWAQYSGKLGDMLLDVSNSHDGPLKELHEAWKSYSVPAGEHLSELMKEQLKNQQELYELWMDAFCKKDQEEGKDSHFEAMNSFFRNMWEQSLTGLPQAAPQDGDLVNWGKEWHEQWMKAYSKSVMELVRSPTFADLNGHTLDANLELKKATESYSNLYLSSMGAPTQQDMDEIHKKLHELDRKMSDIARILKEINGTNK